VDDLRDGDRLMFDLLGLTYTYKSTQRRVPVGE